MPSSPTNAHLFSVLRYRDFRLLWIGNLVSGCGIWIQNLAIGWLILKLSNSPLLLGLYGFATLCPTLALSLVGGTIADRANRRTILIVTQSCLMLLAVLLGTLTLSGEITSWLIIAIALLTGCAIALNSPAYQAILPDLVPDDQLTAAIALNSIQFNVARIVGHAVAGVVVAGVGEAGCFFLNALTYLAMLYALWQVRAPSRHRAGDVIPFMTRMREGIHHVRGERALRSLVLITACVSLLGLPYFFLLPSFGRDVLGAGPRELGYLTASVSVGALGGGLAAASLARRFGRRATLAAAALLFWAGLLAFAFSRNYALSIGFLIVIGFDLAVMIITVSNLLQLLTAPHMRGRVMGIHAMALNGLAPLGALLAGLVAERNSASVAVAVMAVTGLIGTAIPVARLRVPDPPERPDVHSKSSP